MLTFAKAESFLRKYCEDKGYSFEKLKSTYNGEGSALLFGYPKDIDANGLLDDIASQPYPVLAVEMDGDSFKVTETEYTEKYLR